MIPPNIMEITLVKWIAIDIGKSVSVHMLPGENPNDDPGWCKWGRWVKAKKKKTKKRKR